MKKSILLGIIGIAASVATSAYGQGAILLQNYVSSLNPTGNSPVLALGGAPIGASGFTLGLYWATGNITGSIAADGTAGPGKAWGTAIPTSLNAALALATGTGSSISVFDSSGGYPGSYLSAASYNPGAGNGTLITVMLVAYNGANYGASTVRGHSQAFTMTTATGTAFPQHSGDLETDGGFQVQNVSVIPEPTTMALGGLGLASLLLFRRKQA